MKHLKNSLTLLRIAFVTFLLIPFILFAQDSTVSVPSSGVAGLSGKVTLILGLIAGVYELLARLVPTSKNWSILTLIMRIVNAIIPNNKTTSNGDSTTHV